MQIDIGVLKVRSSNGKWDSIALMGGFAEVESDDVTVLVNSAELGASIDSADAEKKLEEAKNELIIERESKTICLYSDN